jgi:hypothetical protein
MFTLVMRDYDEIRRAVQYLRWHDEDAEELVPGVTAAVNALLASPAFAD